MHRARLILFSVRPQAAPAVAAARRKQHCREKVEKALLDRAHNNFSKGVGPRKALQKLHNADLTADEKAVWMESARLDAILGSCCRSMPSVRSGIRAYLGFVEETYGGPKKYFPPQLEWLLAWSTLFRSQGTLGNYLGYVKTGCLILKQSVKVFDHAALGRAKVATAKRSNFASRPKKWIRRTIVVKMMEWALAQADEQYAIYAALFLISYIFLLRVGTVIRDHALALLGVRACASYRRRRCLSNADWAAKGPHAYCKRATRLLWCCEGGERLPFASPAAHTSCLRTCRKTSQLAVV